MTTNTERQRAERVGRRLQMSGLLYNNSDSTVALIVRIIEEEMIPALTPPTASGGRLPIPTTPECVAWAEACMAAEQKLDELRRYAATLSPGPYQWGIIEPERRDEYVIGNLNHGTGDTHLVILPGHKDAVAGADPLKPSHAVTMCITGNGPKSKDNALGIIRILEILTPSPRSQP